MFLKMSACIEFKSENQTPFFKKNSLAEQNGDRC